jgi:elongation factor P--(R)-beta-lysine ligase
MTQLRLRLQARQVLYRSIRNYFFDAGVLEVDTPILAAAGNTDVAIDSYDLREGDSQKWLRTSYF